MKPAGQVAIPVPAATADGDERQCLIFTLQGESFAMDILQIREIIEIGQITEVPMTPDSVRGVINLRGAVVPVIDLSVRFGRGPTAADRRTCIVILELDQGEGMQTVGIMVDGVTEVLEIPAAEIEPPPTFGARLRTDFIAGMGRISGRFVIILDLARVLNFDEFVHLGELAASGALPSPAA